MQIISDGPYKKESVDNMPLQPYEFPNGFNREFGSERFRVPEELFDPALIKVCDRTLFSVHYIFCMEICETAGKSTKTGCFGSLSTVSREQFFK